MHISITCSAADIRHRYLLAVRLIIEKIMISDASRVADSYVRFSADVVLGRSDADARWVDPYKVMPPSWHPCMSPPLPTLVHVPYAAEVSRLHSDVQEHA